MAKREPETDTATKQQTRERRDEEKQQKHNLDAFITKQVMTTLGQPGHLHRVQVRSLWENHYRVNIFIGEDAATAKVAHSFFLVADPQGNIAESTPKITKHY